MTGNFFNLHLRILFPFLFRDGGGGGGHDIAVKEAC